MEANVVVPRLPTLSLPTDIHAAHSFRSFYTRVGIFEPITVSAIGPNTAQQPANPKRRDVCRSPVFNLAAELRM